MWPMDAPGLDVEDTYIRCISRAHASVKRQLAAATPDVVSAAKKSDIAFANASSHLLVQSEFESSEVTTDELKATYTSRMVPAGSPGREIYDELKLSAPDGLCPSCGQRPASQLDHILPKSSYPLVAVCPNNLVPACGECNHTKLAGIAQSPDDVPIHPYYDNIDTEVWLVADILEGSPPGATFRVVAPQSWSTVLEARVVRHFADFGLSQLYSAQAAVELRGIDIAMHRAYERGGPAEVRLGLSDQVEGRQMRFLNNWQAATYRALAASDWYCESRYTSSVIAQVTFT